MINKISTFLVLCLLLVVLNACSRNLIAGEGNMIKVKNKVASWNGVSEIPVGLFGIHNLPLDEAIVEEWGIDGARYIWQRPKGEVVLPGSGKKLDDCHPSEAPPANVAMVLDCFYDRYQPALIVMHDDWKQRLEKLAEAYGKNAGKTGFKHNLEFWNEPYLNWASRPACNYDGLYFDHENAEEGKAMTLRTTGEKFPNMVWEKQMVVVEKQTGRPHYLATRYAEDYRRMKKYKVGNEWRPFEWKEGFEFDFRGIPCQVKTMWWGRDTTQTKYYSAGFNAEMYNRMLKVFGKKLKETNPEVKLIGGWDCNMWNDGWRPFNTLYKPMIDQCWQWLDGVSEHHYGCDTRMVTAEYEVVTAYAKNKYGKTLKMYNTECGGTVDPEKPGKFTPNGSGHAPLANFTYMVRDILHLLAYSPDKVASRAYHQPQNNPGGKEAFLFLKELRGKLLWVDYSVPRVWCVAALKGDQLCIIVYNDNNGPREISLNCDVPVAGSGQLVEAEEKGKKLQLNSKKITGLDKDIKFTVGPRRAVKILAKVADFKLSEKKRWQHGGGDVLQTVRPNAPLEIKIKIDKKALDKAQKAKLRIAHNGATKGAAEIFINGKNINFDSRGDAWLCEQYIDLSLLKTENILTFKAKPTMRYQVLAVSLITVEK